MASVSWTLLPPALRALCCPMLLAGSVAGMDTILRDTKLHAQGIATVAIRGTVRMADDSDPDGARVVVRNTATGYVLDAEVRRGRFLIEGLDPGGPYSILVRRIGALARRWDDVFLTLGEPLQLDVVLEPLAVQLDSVVVVAVNPTQLSCCHGGTATTLSDSLVHHLPTLNRDVYDFLRLVPQLSTHTGFGRGVSAGGVGFRYNGFLTNGVSERSLSGSQPQEFAGGRSLPFEAVREYQVLVAPFDARYGDFGGAVVNTVTRSGTNRFQGSAFAVGRNEALAQDGITPYDRWQLGLSLSGPIVRDRVQFFVASEVQRATAPMVGPFLGQPDTTPPVPVRQADVDRLEAILGEKYGLEAGSGAAIDSLNRISSIFARLDASLPRWNSRAVLWVNDSHTRDRAFSRPPAERFSLSSTTSDRVFSSRTAALQLFTSLRRDGGAHNELSVSHRSLPFASDPETRQPIVQVAVPAPGAAGQTTIVTGTPAQAQGGSIDSWDVILRDDLTLPLGGAHVASIGLESEWFRITGNGLQNGYGTWTFQSLDSLEAGQASRYELARDFGSATRPISGQQLGAYASDSWRIGERLSLTLGLRGDLLAVHERAPYNPLVDSLFGRRTDQRAPRDLYLSPRFGFTWDPQGSGRDQLRGGVGIFTGRPPLAWFQTPLRNYGQGIGLLTCGSKPNDLGAPPAFDPDPFDPRSTCADDVGVNEPPVGNVELVAPDLRLSRTLRVALAYERRLPGGLVGTIEGLVTRNLSDFAFVNLNLVGPQGTDRRGRVLYGTFDSLGQSIPTLVTDRLPSVIDLRSVSRNHAVQLSASLAKQFEGGVSVMASYTWSRVRDLQTPLRVNVSGFDNWELQAVSGRHDDPRPGISLNDVPHRVVLAGTWRAPWRRWLTELSLLYVGESGSPFTYVVGDGADGLGDLNADGGLNDPIYVPRSALDAGEIVFTGVSGEEGADNSPEAQQERVRTQRAALDRFTGSRTCLRRQRGRIAARNSCREPWTNTTAASLRQTIPLGAQAVEVQLDVFNLLNLLDGDWGLRRFANPVLLEQVGQTVGPPGPPEPVFRLVEQAMDWTTDPTASAFQLQFGVRYRF